MNLKITLFGSKFPALVLLFLFFIDLKLIAQTANLTDRFYIGTMNFFKMEAARSPENLKRYKSLSYNLMQNYCGHFDSLPSDWKNSIQRDGGFFEDTASYGNYIRNVILQWYSVSGLNSLILEREKILRPAYGQRSSYQAEDAGSWNGKLPAYGFMYSDFDNSHDITENWMGENVRVKYCKSGKDKPGYVVKVLVDNCEQISSLDVSSENSNGLSRLFSDIKQPSYKNRWYIKPRMRIDAKFALENPDIPVAMVYVLNFKGVCIDSILITCNNFLEIKEGGKKTYDGSYIELYRNMSPERMSVSAALLSDGAGNPSDSKVDYMVKWLGKADMWLDYVRLDDSWAHFLFTDSFETEMNNSLNPWKFHHKIKEEVESFLNIPGLGYFWIDETAFNNIPCIAEVKKLVEKYSNGKYSVTFIADPVAFVGNGLLRNRGADWSIHWKTAYDTLFASNAVSNLIICQFFPQLYWILYPNTLKYDQASPVEKYIVRSSYEKYYGDKEEINWDGYITYLNRTIKLMRFVSSSARIGNLTFGAITQLNSDEAVIRKPGVDWGLREPTNEEISVTNFLAMCYGAKIILQFSYNTFDQRNGLFNRGLTTPDYSGVRELNYYGQHKWQFMEKLNKQMTEIGSIMYPEGKSKEHLVYDGTATVDSKTGSGLPFKYITDIQSIMRDASSEFSENPQCLNCDPSEKRFWEIGFFSENSESAKPGAKSYYFLALNKRTYPEINNTGDKRLLKIKFNTAELQSSAKWELRNAVTGEVYASLSNNSGFVSAGVYNPGEAKLLKLVPSN